MKQEGRDCIELLLEIKEINVGLKDPRGFCFSISVDNISAALWTWNHGDTTCCVDESANPIYESCHHVGACQPAHLTFDRNWIGVGMNPADHHRYAPTPSHLLWHWLGKQASMLKVHGALCESAFALIQSLYHSKVKTTHQIVTFSTIENEQTMFLHWVNPRNIY